MIAELDSQPTPEQIDAVLEYLPIFQREDFLPVVANAWSPDGPVFFGFEYWARELSEFQMALYDNGFITSFNWPDWQEEARRLYEHPELIKLIDLETIRQLFIVHVRKERFCEGHFSSVVESGHVLLLLERLKELRDPGAVEKDRYKAVPTDEPSR